MRAGREALNRAALACAATFVLLAVPTGALADGITGGLQQVTTTTTSTVTSTTDALGDALGSTQDALPPIDQVVSDTTTTVADTTSDLLVAAGQALGGSSGAGTTSSSPASSSSSPQSPSDAGSAPAPAASSSSASRSGRALSAAPWGGFAPPAASPTLGFAAFAPPPPRYGGEAGGSLATTGVNAALPIGVLVLLMVLGIGTRTAEELRARIRMYGALTYHGKHRMPRRSRLRLALAA